MITYICVAYYKVAILVLIKNPINCTVLKSIIFS